MLENGCMLALGQENGTCYGVHVNKIMGFKFLEQLQNYLFGIHMKLPSLQRINGKGYYLLKNFLIFCLVVYHNFGLGGFINKLLSAPNH